MFKWIVFTALLMGLGFLAYNQYRAGYFTRPEMPEGAFSLSYKSGLRGILVSIPDERTTRRYFGYRAEVPFYLEASWSFCRPPREDEQQSVSTFMKRRDWPGERFEAVCEIDVDGEAVIRGWITSVPKL
jgi:hypothetical protein